MSGKKQVILIMTDTQRADMLGCYADTGLKTPNLDRMAGQGVRFDRAYDCQPVCGPARAAMFTGIYPHSNGGWGNSMAIGDNVKTLGQTCQTTACTPDTSESGTWTVETTLDWGNAPKVGIPITGTT